jgi:DNA-binding IclR family transcriptional regulator
MEDSDTISIQSLKTAKDIIDFLIENDGAGVTETAEQLDKPVTTTYEYLLSMSELGYVIRGSDGYYPSSLYLSIGTRIREKDKLYTTAKPEIDSFADEIEENITLLKEEGGYGITLYTIENNKSIQITTKPGERTPLHLSAGGKAILAHLPHQRVEEIIDNIGLARMTENTITDPEELFEELETIRDKGFAISRQEDIVGINEAAVPIAVDNSRSIGAVLVYGPASRLTGKRLKEEIPDKLANLKDIVESNLTYAHYMNGED